MKLLHRVLLLLVAWIVRSVLFGSAVTFAAEPRVSFPQSLAPVPREIARTKQAIAPGNQADLMEFGIALKLRNYAQMQGRIARGEVIARDELERFHLPLPADYEKVVQWLESEGFHVTQHDPSRLVVYVRGSVAQIERSLQVRMVTVSANGGRSYHVAETAPSLPLDIATPVLGVNHLQPYHQRTKRAIRQPLTNNAPPFRVGELMTAYNGASLGVTGAGQKIAILIDTTAKSSDLAAFWSANNIPQSTANIENINVNGGTLPAASGEETLDEEWASGVAPGAKIRVYASRTLSDADLDKCLQRLINDLPTQPQLHQLSISLGLGETYISQTQFDTDAQLFATIVSGGVNIFVSSGDGGSTPDEFGGSSGPLQVEHYASDPSVTAVGGTSLYVNATTGVRTSESAWSGSGGGDSVQFARPVWQVGAGVPSGTSRELPDVALAADPNTGAYVYLGGVQQYGGTSWGAPVWAGFCALVNEARANAGKPPLGLINPSLYPLIGTNCFVDITSGGNATATSNGKYAATDGYDRATGIGVPHMANLLASLVAQMPPAPLVISFSPASGVENTQVVITGANFNSVTTVKFNGTAAAFTVNSTTQLTAFAPTGASTGPISVTTTSGTGSSSTAFTVLPGPPAPSIAGFTPAYGLPGTVVTITGANFTAATSVRFGGVTASSFSVNSPSQITATVPNGAVSGPIAVATSSGTTSSGAAFTVLSGTGAPTVTSFSPAAGDVGTTVTITGTNFVNVTGVTFGGIAASAPMTASATSTVVSVPAGAATGRIVVTTGLGSGSSASDFAVTSAAGAPVTISQVYGGGGNSGATYLNDFIELYNRSGTAVDLTGWSVQYSSATGTNWTVTSLSGTMLPGHYYLVKGASGGGTATALPTPDATNTSLNLSASSGKVALMHTTMPIFSGLAAPFGLAGLVDFVGYGGADAYEGSGTAQSPSAKASALRTSGGATDSGDNSLDFVTGTPNPRNSTIGAAAPDLSITKLHAGNFTQGDTGKSYTITVTNLGTAPSSGVVTVTDSLPAGLTATGFSGPGWTVNLATLTATRSDSLSSAGSYPSLTLTVNVAGTATSLINVASVAGGGDSNSANNTTNDPTTINSSGSGGGTPVVLASWDASNLSAYGPSPFAGTAAANVNVGGLTRGVGIGQGGTAASFGWGGTSFTDATAAQAISANKGATFSIEAATGYSLSLSSISKFSYRRSSTGPPTALIQAQVGSGAFFDLATVNYTSTSSGGANLAAIDLSTFASLQNLAGGTTVTFRIVNYGASGATGSWYIFDTNASTAADFAVSGVVTPVSTGTPDLSVSSTHSGSFTQADVGRTYTLNVANVGNAASAGTVTLTDSLPPGLTATGMAGSGWAVNLATSTATRSDSLAAGASYPPLILTVNIAADASSIVTNTVQVSGGGETNAGNSTASDPTSIVPLTPAQSWRNQWFGNPNDSGPGADLVIAAGDGIPNLIKYALNLVPPQLPSTLQRAVVVDQAGGNLRMTISKNTAASDLVFTVEGSSTLADPQSWSSSGLVIDQNTASTLQVHDSTPLTSGPRFLRLRVTRP